MFQNHAKQNGLTILDRKNVSLLPFGFSVRKEELSREELD